MLRNSEALHFRFLPISNETLYESVGYIRGSSSIEKSSDPNVINKHSIQHRKETDKTIVEFIVPIRIIDNVFYFAY